MADPIRRPPAASNMRARLQESPNPSRTPAAIELTRVAARAKIMVRTHGCGACCGHQALVKGGRLLICTLLVEPAHRAQLSDEEARQAACCGVPGLYREIQEGRRSPQVRTFLRCNECRQEVDPADQQAHQTLHPYWDALNPGQPLLTTEQEQYLIRPDEIVAARPTWEAPPLEEPAEQEAPPLEEPAEQEAAAGDTASSVASPPAPAAQQVQPSGFPAAAPATRSPQLPATTTAAAPVTNEPATSPAASPGTAAPQGPQTGGDA